MNEISTPEKLIEEVEIQAPDILDDCIENLTIAYTEYLENKDNKDNKEIKEIFVETENDLKILLGEYAFEREDLIPEAYDILFEEIESSLKD